MTKNIVILIVIVLVLAGGVYYYISQQPTAEQPVNSQVNVNTEADMPMMNDNMPVLNQTPNTIIPTNTVPTDTNATPTANVPATSSQITIQNFTFSPSTLTVSAGTTVTWTNQDSVGHSVVFDTFKSDVLSNGNSFSHAFTQAGTYNYHCGIHPTMTGKIIVQ